MKRCMIIAQVVAVLCCAGCRASRNPEAEAAAVAAASEWLAMTDAGQYVESWDSAADIFKCAVTKAQWLKTMQTFRTPLGGNISRTIKSKSYRTSMPGIPDGEYVIIRFKTSFANKKSTVETVTPMLNNDGKWRVSGYFIK